MLNFIFVSLAIAISCVSHTSRHSLGRTDFFFIKQPVLLFFLDMGSLLWYILDSSLVYSVWIVSGPHIIGKIQGHCQAPRPTFFSPHPRFFSSINCGPSHLSPLMGSIDCVHCPGTITIRPTPPQARRNFSRISRGLTRLPVRTRDRGACAARSTTAYMANPTVTPC